MRRIITKNLRTSVYNALINFHLAYGTSIWGSSASQVKLKNLFVLQKKAIRNLFGIKKESKNVKGHTKPTFNDNNIFFFIKKVFIIYNYIIMGTQKRTYKHGDQKHLHRSIMAITSGPIYLKHKKYFILSIYNI